MENDKLVKELIDTLTYRFTPERAYQFQETIAHLSLDSQTICEIIFNSPVDFAKMVITHTPKETRSEIARILREEHMWSWARIWDSFREIKLTLRKELR